MALRRSERQSVKLHSRYYAEYQKIKITLKPLVTVLIASFNSNFEYKIGIIIKITKLMGDNFAFIIKYEYNFTQTRPLEIYCDMLYKKLFEWINETISKKDLEPNYLINFKKTAKNYRKIYEKNRYAPWIFIKSRFNLDDNIMFRINSYLHYFVANK
jgi:hypothetical protein